jgi:hypothetical protein
MLSILSRRAERHPRMRRARARCGPPALLPRARHGRAGRRSFRESGDGAFERLPRVEIGRNRDALSRARVRAPPSSRRACRRRSGGPGHRLHLGPELPVPELALSSSPPSREPRAPPPTDAERVPGSCRDGSLRVLVLSVVARGLRERLRRQRPELLRRDRPGEQLLDLDDRGGRPARRVAQYVPSTDSQPPSQSGQVSPGLPVSPAQIARIDPVHASNDPLRD